MSDSDTEAMITNIMTTIGVAPADFERAGANFHRLPTDELSGRLERERAGERVLENWCATQGQTPTT